MATTKTRKTSVILAEVNDITGETGIRSNADLANALAKLKELRESRRKLKGLIADVDAADAELSGVCTEYALANPDEVFADGEPFVTLRDDLRSGVFDAGAYVEGAGLFRFSETRSRPSRTSGDNMNAKFLKDLPQEWTRQKLELNLAALHGVDDDTLLEKGLARQLVRSWSSVEEKEAA